MTAEHWEDAAKSLDAAENLAANHELQERVAEMRREWSTVARLNEIRRLWPGDGLKVDQDPVIAAFRQTFLQYGLDPEAATEAMKERGRTSPIRAHLIPALDYWVGNTERAGTRYKLLDFADALDDSAARRAVRAAVRDMDRSKLLRLSQEADVTLLSAPTLALLSTALVNAGASQAAEDMLRRELLHYSDDGLIQLELGWLLSSQDRLAEKEAALRDAIRLWPSVIAARFHLSDVLEKQNKLEESEAVIRDLLRLNDKHTGAWELLGLLFHRQNKASEAELVYREALKRLPDSAQLYSDLGVTLVKQKRITEAEASFREAVRLDPSHDQAVRNLYILLDRTDQWDEAEELLRAATRTIQYDDALWLGLSGILIAKEEFTEAEAAHCNRLWRVDPTAAFARFRLVRVLEAQGKFDKALSELQKVNFVELPNALEELDCRERLEQAVLLDRKLPVHSQEDLQPPSAEKALIFGWICHCRRSPVRAVFWFEEAFRAQPQILDKPGFDQATAAVSAVRAAASYGDDEPPTDTEPRATSTASVSVDARCPLSRNEICGFKQ